MATIEKAVMDSHRNLKRAKTLETGIEVDPTYGNAIEEHEEKSEETAKMLGEMEAEAGKTTVATPNTGKKVERKPYTEKFHLNESLFEDYMTEKKGVVEDLPDDAWTLVYDSIFEGNRFKRPHIVETNLVFDKNRAYTSAPVGDYDIGVIVKTMEEEDYIYDLADKLELRVDRKTRRPDLAEGDVLLIIKMDEETSKKPAKEFLAEKEINIDDIRTAATAKPKKKNECKLFADTNKKLEESAKIIMDLGDYQPWSGAVRVWDEIRDNDMVDALDNYLEEMYPEGLTVTELNDLLWFDGEDVLSSLGLGKSQFEEIDSKTVYDSNGFTTDYTWYRRESDGLNLFVFGDKDRYTPDDGEEYWDYSTESDEEAKQWFDNYTGFEDEED